MTFTIHPVILCGGSGTRLWPLSTPEIPKQFLALTSSNSMIEETAARFETTSRSDLHFAPLLVVGAKRHEQLLTDTLPGADLILEPMGRNSAPAVAAASMVRGPNDLILILPADHEIRDVPAFHNAIAAASTAAESGAIVTFGIEPTHPATGYGYIKAASGSTQPAVTVEAFVEKPDGETAQGYLDTGDYYWNAGIFLFKASVMLEALDRYAPKVNAGTRAALGNAPGKKVNLDKHAFAETPSISIDYAVMERASNVKTVPVDMGWSDVGGYRALHELMTERRSDNYMSGPIVAQNATGNYIRSEGPAIALNGVSNLVIVATSDEVMITPLSEDGAAKGLGQMVQDSRASLGFSPELIDQARAWLFNAFDVWSEVGWDVNQGGFVEQLQMDGTPDADADRRTRVQARQVFSFCQAIELGWPKVDTARALIEQGLEYIDKRLRHPEGGFVHGIKADGTVIDERRDLYDHAFFILAGAAANRVIGSELGLKVADDAIAYIDRELKDHTHGGWFESNQFELPRRANPHMHMLEAMLEYYAATASEHALDRAGEIVRLFETSFFNASTNVMAEFFEEDWRVQTDAEKTLFEPGHHFEWSSLLSVYDTMTKHDSISFRRRLIKKALKIGINTRTNFAINQMQADGIVRDPNSRLWHQLEMFRAFIHHPGIVESHAAGDLLSRVLDTYLCRGPRGGWVDEIDAFGEVYAKKVPASMLYHIVTAFSPVV